MKRTVTISFESDSESESSSDTPTPATSAAETPTTIKRFRNTGDRKRRRETDHVVHVPPCGSVCWSRTPFKTDRSMARIVVGKLLLQKGKAVFLSELVGVDDPQDAAYKTTRLHINNANQQVRNRVKEGDLALIHKMPHEGCKHDAPHIICTKGSYFLPMYWIDDDIIKELKAAD